MADRVLDGCTLKGGLPALTKVSSIGYAAFCDCSVEGYVVLHSAVKGILFIDNGTPEVLARVGAGESFDGFCALAASKGLWGTENLSLIPGEAGAAAVQHDTVH